MKLSIIIPAHNEETRIGKTLEEYGKFLQDLKKKKKLDFEIIVVLNACKDNTVGIVKNAEKKYKEIRHLDFEQGGKGFAVKEGFKEALKGKAELIGFVDADMATRPDVYYELVKNIGDCDGVIGSRYISGSVLTPKQGFSRRMAGIVFNVPVRASFFMPYRDTQCGCKLFKREVIAKVLEQMSISGWAFDVDLL
ncbi:glycosyltransferase, partial [archaeon]|nr:glycosyltransferase [archaeon]